MPLSAAESYDEWHALGSAGLVKIGLASVVLTNGMSDAYEQATSMTGVCTDSGFYHIPP